MEQKTDLRIIKTHKALTESIESLLLEKPLSEITVNEICERAMVRRATFYKHFGDKYELLTFVFKEMQTEIKEIQDKTHLATHGARGDFYRDIVIMLKYIESNESLFLALNNDCSTGTLSNLVADSITRAIKDYLAESGNTGITHSTSSSLMYQLLTGAFLYGIAWWLNHKEQITVDEMAKQLSDFVINVVDDKNGVVSSANAPVAK